MSTPEECEGAKPKVSLSDRGLVWTSCSHDVGPHMEADDGHATHWIWHFSMQVHCKPRRNVQKQCSLARVGARDIWRPTTVTQPIEFGTSACKCTASLVEKSRSNAASPGLVPETSCRPSAGVTHCKPVVAGVCTRCRQELQAGHTVQALAAGVIQIAGRGCGYHTRSSRRLRVPKCEQLLRVLHTVQAEPWVTHALQTWAAGGVPGWGQHTLGSRRLQVSGHPLRAGLRVLHAVQTEVCGWGTHCGQGCKCL